MLVAFTSNLPAGCSNPAKFFTWRHEVDMTSNVSFAFQKTYIVWRAFYLRHNLIPHLIWKKKLGWVIHHTNQMQLLSFDDPGNEMSPNAHYSHVCIVHKTICGYMHVASVGWNLCHSFWDYEQRGLQEAGTTLETVKTAAWRLVLRN